MGSGWLVSAYGDATSGSQTVYDTKADDVRLSRDIFVRVCHPAHNLSQCGLASDWSAPLNISNTAHIASIATKWDESNIVAGEIVSSPFYGDSEKPNIFVAGNFAVVTWVGKYCEGDKQRLISYTAREGLSVPFSCLYMSYTNNVAGIDGEPAVWNTQQITDGQRDAKSDFNKGLSIDGKGKWVFSWQEDPHGLQLGAGAGAGPGEGASGATVTHGTDVWYTYTEDLMLEPLAPPVRISDNYQIDGAGGNTSPIFHPDDPENEIVVLERGNTGASRPNLMLVGGSTPPTAVIAYEESKGADRLDSGKFVRYHEFAFNAPPVSTGQYENGEPGCIISDPLENSRRVRFVAQPTASANGLRMGVFWRQGLPTEGGPADIMVRVGKNSGGDGSTGLRPEDMEPAVDFVNCSTSDYLIARELNNVPASNISSNTIPWTPLPSPEDPNPTSPFGPNDLADTSSLNPYEDSKAHRAAIVGEDFYIGYSYAKDWAVATVIDLDNYNFWLRRYNAGSGGTWTDATNISNITDVKTHVKEPRLVKTPGSGAGCTDETYLENCQNKSALIVAWGTESNVYGHIGGSEEFDIYYRRTEDKGVTFDPPLFDDTDPSVDPVPISGVIVEGIGYNNRFESQLRPSPAGNIIWTVWNEAENQSDGGNIATNAMLSVSDESVGTAPPPPPGGETPPPPPPADSYDLLIESLEMDLDNPVIDVNGIYYVPPKTNDIPARVTVKNVGGLPVSGVVTAVETIQGGGFNFSFEFGPLGTGETAKFDFTWDSRNKESYTWQATVSATDTDGEDRDIDNNTMRVETIISPFAL